MSAARSELFLELRRILGDEGWLADRAARRVYARDASYLEGGRPLAVALPAAAATAQAVVAACARHGVPVTCRGGGTGLSGGAVPGEGAVVLSLARLTALAAFAPVERRIFSGAGVLNAQVSRHAAAAGLHFAPDPSSQSAATIGGNVAENAGGPHCLLHGVTLQHVLGLHWIDASGEAWRTGRELPVERGLDLRPLLCGSEGTLGVVTGAALRLTPLAPAAATLLAFFDRIEDGGRAVVALFGSGLLPVALEMVDRSLLEALAAAFAFGFPTDRDAGLIVEFAGRPEEVAEDAARAREILEAHAARGLRVASDDAERAELWRCRKKGFGAVGRLTPRYISMDVVVPLGELPALVAEIRTIKDEHGVEAATAFHAGDGNCHPGIHYDDREPDSRQRALAAADAVLRAALKRRGSITGEHGVGLEKRHALAWQLDEVAGSLMRGVKRAFDPAGLLNPGKLLPPADAVWAPPRPQPETLIVDAASLTATAPGSTRVAALQAAALARGLWLPVGLWSERAEGMPGLGRAGTVAELVDHLVGGPGLLAARSARELLLEIWATTGDGRDFHAGAPVLKDVAGYDFVRFLAGTAGALARIRAATFQLRPVPERAVAWRFAARGSEAVLRSRFGAVARLAANWSDERACPVLVVEDGLDADPVPDAGPVESRAVGVGKGAFGTAALPRAGQLTVVVAGRDRPWDLARRRTELIEAIGRGASLAAERTVPFPRAAELLDTALIAPWALAAADWTLLQHGGEAATASSLDPPPGRRRWIWQAAPRGIWVPRADVEPPRGWHADNVWRGGRLLDPPAPPAAVPRDLLRRLKELFDPDGELPAFSWLGATVASGSGAVANPPGDTT